LFRGTNAFQEVAQTAGIEWSGQLGNDAFSVAWVDFNSDGLADLWISPHGYRATPAPKVPSLYQNQGGGRFRKVTDQVWPGGIQADTHGSAWADFDNDGDPDLLVSTGSERGLGTGGNLLFVNDGGQLVLQKNARGLLYDLGRGRSPLWFDENQDGRLDALLLTSERPNKQGPSAVFRQNSSGQFSNVSESVGFRLSLPARSAQLVDLTGDGKLDVSIQGTYAYPLKTYDISKAPFKALRGVIPIFKDYPANSSKDFEETKAPRDAVIADFNGDQHPDLFLPRALVTRFEPRIFRASDQRSAEAALVLKQAGEIGMGFKTRGAFTVDFLERSAPNPSKIFIGSQGNHPSQTFFTLNASDPQVTGIKPHTPGTDTGVYIGYDPASQIWKAIFSSSRTDQIGLLVRSQKPLFTVKSIGFNPSALRSSALSPKLLIYDPSLQKYVDKTAIAGLSKPILGQYAVAGDFDNDMDIDLYVSCSHFTADVPDILYRNQGSGTFVSAAIGAAGLVIAPHFTDFSLGPKVAVADYDNDGFLDLFTSNTVLAATQKTYLGTPPRLLHNLGNSNHWLEIKLRGVQSNRDGIGARILATANGITQLREQGGGMHQYAQNQQRIHLGLGPNQLVDRLVIQWPSGIVQTLKDVPADQVLTVTEQTSV
jgi:hypothetical protein